MINKILFVGRATAETTTGWNNWAMISINEPVSALGEAKLLKGWHAVHPVSYTHLDVYKRQPWSFFRDNIEEEYAVKRVR